MTTKLELIAELNKTNYKDLEEEFKKRGVPSAFKEGHLKADMIEDAANQLIALDDSIKEEAPIKSNLNTETLATILRDTDYHKLRSVLDEHGIVGTLRGGQKKTELIESALRRFSEIQLLLNDGDKPIKTKGELIKRVEADDLDRIADDIERAKQSDLNQKAKDKVDRDAIVKTKLTKAQVIKAIAQTARNIGNVPSQREILIKKQKALQYMLDNKKYIKE
jgi:hypothetical protein